MGPLAGTIMAAEEGREAEIKMTKERASKNSFLMVAGLMMLLLAKIIKYCTGYKN